MKPVPVVLVFVLLVTVLLATASPSEAGLFPARPANVDCSLNQSDCSFVEEQVGVEEEGVAATADTEGDRADSDTVVVERANRAEEMLLTRSGAFTISRFNPSIVGDFEAAWRS